MLDRSDARWRWTRLADRVFHDSMQLARDLFHDVLLGIWRLREAGAVHKESRIEVLSETLQQPMDVLPNCAQCSQNHARQETLDDVGEISDKLVGQRLLVDNGTRLSAGVGLPVHDDPARTKVDRVAAAITDAHRFTVEAVQALHDLFANLLMVGLAGVECDQAKSARLVLRQDALQQRQRVRAGRAVQPPVQYHDVRPRNRFGECVVVSLLSTG